MIIFDLLSINYDFKNMITRTLSLMCFIKETIRWLVNFFFYNVGRKLRDFEQNIFTLGEGFS